MGIFEAAATAVAAEDKHGRVPLGSLDPDWGKLTGLGDPAATWAYRDGLGHLIGYVARWETTTGKTIRQSTWRGNKWTLDHFAKPGPLYGLDRLAERPDALVLIVEGEACADAARALLPGFVAVSWAGGCNAVAKADWSVLAGRSVTIWPDADEPGAKASAAIAGALGRCTVLDLAGLDKPRGWDVGDAIAEGWDTAAALAFIAERGKMQGAESDDDWAYPDDLVQVGVGAPYPVEALPRVVRMAVEEVQAFVQAPVAMVAGAALGALSMAAQALFDVDRDNVLTGPCGLFLLTIAESGERKSSCDGYFARPVMQWEKDRAEALAPAVAEANDRLAAWSEHRDGLKAMIKTARRVPSKGSVADLTAELIATNENKPATVKVPVLRRGDVTPEELGFQLATGWPSAGIVSSEAGVVFGSHGMGDASLQRNLGLLNILWDGGSHRVERRTSESYTIDGARLTMALQTQEASLRAFIANGKGLARGMGFFARFLIAWPESTQGGRDYREVGDMPAVANFGDRLRELLDRPVPLDDAGVLTPERVTLAHDAKAAWIAYHDGVEAKLGRDGDLSDVRDIASKSADNAARLAGLFYALEYSDGRPINADCMTRGCTLAAWYLAEARRLFAGLALDPGMKAAIALDRWLVARCASEGVRSVPTAAVAQYGPYSVRVKSEREAAMAVLGAHNRARLVERGKARMIAVNPMLLQ